MIGIEELADKFVDHVVERLYDEGYETKESLRGLMLNVLPDRELRREYMFGCYGWVSVDNTPLNTYCVSIDVDLHEVVDMSKYVGEKELDKLNDNLIILIKEKWYIARNEQ